MKFTETTLRRLTAESGRREVMDDDLPGFGVRVSESGRKVFFVKVGKRGNRKRITLGPWGTVTLTRAKDRARDLLAEARLGLLDNRPPAPTFTEWSTSYLKEVSAKKKNPSPDRRYLGSGSVARKVIGSKPLDTITRSDIRTIIDRVYKATLRRHGQSIRALEQERYAIVDGAKNERAHRKINSRIEKLKARENPGKSQANRCLAAIRACIQEAARDEWIDTNPAMGLRPFRENPPRSRVLADEEMNRLIKAITGEPDPNVRAAFRLLVETGARRSEVLRARWKDFDLDSPTAIWRIPSPKAGYPQVVPLASNTVAMLRRAPRVGPWLIPGRDPLKPRSDLKRPWDNLVERAKLQDVTLHDIRRTFGLEVARKARLHVASKLLRHADVRVTERVYAPLGIEELQRAMEKAQRPAEVIDIEERRP